MGTRFDTFSLRHANFWADTETHNVEQTVSVQRSVRDRITGPKDVRPWTFGGGWSAPQCAGVIHTDFERGFMKAEVYAIPDLLEHGSETALKGVGKLRMEGRAYEVNDGDVMHFRFNV